MAIQDSYDAMDNNFNTKLELMLIDNRREMQERAQTILLGINSHAIEAKKEVHHHLVQLVKVHSALSKSTIH